MVEVEAALKEQKKISGKLRDTQEKKMYEIAVVDKEIASEIEKYRWNKGKIENEIRLCTEEANVKIREFVAQETELLVETAGFDVLERENERLNAKFKELILEKDSLDKSYTKEVEQRNDKDFTTRIQMEEILRKVIRSNDNNYNKDAIQKMVYEASLADTENIKIRSEFSTREKQTNSLIKKQEHSLEMLKKINIERELTESSANYQKAEVYKIINVIEGLEMENDALIQSIEVLSREISALEVKYSQRKVLTEELHRLQRKLKADKEKKKVTIDATVILCEKILKETLAMAEKFRVTYSMKVSQKIADDNL